MQVSFVLFIAIYPYFHRTVVNKVDKISAEYRNFELELIAGEESYITSVTERGITYLMDFSKVKKLWFG